MLNIVIIGMDNTGKSTLCENISKLLGEVGNVRCIHSLGNVPIKKQMEFMENELSPGEGVDFKIFDRFPIIEEKVYGKLLRNKDRYSEMPEYEKQQLDKIDLFIYCDPGIKNIKKWNGREQMSGVIDNCELLYDEYNKVFNYLKNKGYNIIKYDYTKDDYQNLMEIK